MKHPIARAGVICLLLAATTVFLANARRSEVPVAREPFSEFPMAIGNWQAVVNPPLEENVLKVLGVDDYLSRVYYQATGAVGLYLGFYGSQRQGDTIHSPLNCLPGAGWEPVSTGQLHLLNVDAAGRDITVNRYVVQKGLDRNLVLYWYHGRGRVVANEYMSRALLIRDAMVRNRTDGSLVRVLAPIASGEESSIAQAEALAGQFVRDLFPFLDSYLP